MAPDPFLPTCPPAYQHLTTDAFICLSLHLPFHRNHHRRHSSVDRDDVRRWEPLSPWCMLRASVSHFKKRLKPEALTAMAELFLLNPPTET